MPSLIPRKIRRYKSEYPYSYPLLFMILEALDSIIKIAVVAVVLLTGYMFFKGFDFSNHTAALTESNHVNNQNGAQQKQGQPTLISASATTEIAIDKPRLVITDSTVPGAQRSTEHNRKQTTSDSTIASEEKFDTPVSIGKSEETPQSRLGSNIKRSQEGINWISQLGSSDYIIQFASTPDEQAIIEFSREHLPAGAVVYPFRRTPSGRPVFGVASEAVFKSLDAAKDAIDELPYPLKQTAPWIRPATTVKRAVSATMG